MAFAIVMASHSHLQAIEDGVCRGWQEPWFLPTPALTWRLLLMAFAMVMASPCSHVEVIVDGVCHGDGQVCPLLSPAGDCWWRLPWWWPAPLTRRWLLMAFAMVMGSPSHLQVIVDGVCHGDGQPLSPAGDCWWRLPWWWPALAWWTFPPRRSSRQPSLPASALWTNTELYH